MADPITADELLEEIRKAREGGGTTPASAPKANDKSWLATYSPTQLRYAFRAGLIDEAEWQQELISRGETPTSARAEIEKQKQTGLSTAASTRGQLTAAEKAGVDAMTKTGAPPGRPQVLDSWESPAQAKAGLSTVSGEPFGRQAAGASSGAVGPGGRTFDQVTGTDYVNDAERQWYLSQTKSGGGSTSRASGGGSGTSSSGGGGGSRVAANTGRDDPGSTFTVRGADGNTYHWREYERADGSRYFRNLETDEMSDRLPTAVQEQPKKKLSPLEQAAQSLAGANRTLAGGEGQASVTTDMNNASAPAAQGEPRLMTADNGSRLTGLDMPGYGTLNTVGAAGNNVTDILGAAHLRSSGDPQKDLQTVLGILGERSLLEKQGMSPLEIQTMVDQRAQGRAFPNGGGYPNYNTGFVPQVGTGTHNASGRLVIDDTPGNYRELLQPTDEDPYAFAAGGGFKTPNPIAFVDMITGQPLGMAGGAGRETVSVDPDGPHGTPATEAKVGSRLWPQLTGVQPYANGIDDLLNEYGFTSSGPMQSAGPQVEPPGGGAPMPDYGAENGGRDPDYVSASMLGYGQNGGKERAPNYEGVDRYFRPTLSPKEKYDMRVAQGWAQPEVLYPRANDAFKSWLRAGNFSDPIARLPEHMLPSQFLEDSSLTKARDVARRPEWYGLSEFYQADGAENTTGGASYFDNPPHPQRWGLGQVDDLFAFKGLVNSGAFENASRDWQSLTPNQQLGAWSYMSLPGMGNPYAGNTWLPALSFGSNMRHNRYWLQNDGNLAPTPPGTYAELQPSVYQPPANLQTFMNTPVGQNPTGGIVTQRTGPPTGAKGPVTMAGGGMGEAGMVPMQEPQTPFSMLLETLLVKPTKGNRKPPLRPVGATMGGYAA